MAAFRSILFIGTYTDAYHASMSGNSTSHHITPHHNIASRRTSLYHTSRIQNPDIPRAGQGGAAHGGTAERSGRRQNRTPAGRFAQETTVPLNLQKSKTNVTNVFGKHEQTKSRIKRWRNTTSGRQPIFCFSADQNKGPISIFGPISKVEDQAEDPDPRGAEKTLGALVDGGSEEKGSGVLRSSGREGGRWRVLRSSSPENRRWGLLVLRNQRIEESPPHLRRTPSSKKSSPSLPSSL